MTAVLQLAGGDLAAPMVPVPPGPGVQVSPLGWQVSSPDDSVDDGYRRAFGPETTYAHASVMPLYGLAVAEGQPGPWRAYCTPARAYGPEYASWHPTAEQAMAAVEAFVAQQVSR